MIKFKNQKSIAQVGESERGKEGRIGYLLRQASVAHRIKVEKILVKWNITLPQFSVISFLKLYPGISNADLARLTLLTPQTVCVIVSNLERMKLISKHPHSIHGRIQHIELTEAGSKLLKESTKEVEAFQDELVKGLSSKEQEIVKNWLISVAL